MWGRWMQHAVPRIRSAVLATRPLRPYAHQDEAVFTDMLAQPRLRFLLADEPGTGKTIMTGMYISEGTRRGLVPGRTVIVVPAHLVEKWKRDLRRYFAIDAAQITAELARDPRDLDPRVSVWVVSVDLYTYNLGRAPEGVRRSGVVVTRGLRRGSPAHPHVAVPRRRAPSLPTAPTTCCCSPRRPHRGKEHFFRGLLNLLDPTLYPWDPRQDRLRDGAAALNALVPAPDEGGAQGPRGQPPLSAAVRRDGARHAHRCRAGGIPRGHGLRRHATTARTRRWPGPSTASGRRPRSSPPRRRSGAATRPSRDPRPAGPTLPVPDEFAGADGELSLAVDDDNAWERAEETRSSTPAARDKTRGAQRDQPGARADPERRQMRATDEVAQAAEAAR